MPFFRRNIDDSSRAKTPVDLYTAETPSIHDAFMALLLSNTPGEMEISEFLKLIPNELSPVDRNLLNNLAAYLVDLTIVTQEIWSTATDAQLVALDPNEAAATQAIGLLAAGSVPTLTGWAAEVTTTENRVIIARIPLAAEAADYRIHAVQGSTTTDQRLQYVTERAPKLAV